MDEELVDLAQRYAHKRHITLSQRLGFGIHGIVFAVEDNTKPGFFAVKCHREAQPFERECRAYQRLREKQVAQIRGFNVPQFASYGDGETTMFVRTTEHQIEHTHKALPDSGRRQRINDGTPIQPAQLPALRLPLSSATLPRCTLLYSRMKSATTREIPSRGAGKKHSIGSTNSRENEVAEITKVFQRPIFSLSRP